MQARPIVVLVGTRQVLLESFTILLWPRLFFSFVILLFIFHKWTVFFGLGPLDFLKLLGCFSPLLSQPLLERVLFFFWLQFLHRFSKSNGCILVELLFSELVLVFFYAILLLFEEGKFVRFFLVLFSLLLENFKILELALFVLKLRLKLVFFLFRLELLFELLILLGFESLELHMILQILFVPGLNIVFVVLGVAQ